MNACSAFCFETGPTTITPVWFWLAMSFTNIAGLKGRTSSPRDRVARRLVLEVRGRNYPNPSII
jgi:hypothetical protein